MKNKFQHKGRPSPRGGESKRFEAQPQGATIADLSRANIGKRFYILGLIDQIEQTGGPTIFYLNDGTGSLPLKAFEGAGVRAYPHLNAGDAVNAIVTIGEFDDALQGEVDRMLKLEEKDRQDLLVKISEIERERAKVKPIDFLVEDPILHKLKERFIKAATEIRLAIIQNRPIIIRHHNDTDGYSSGYALERAILPLIVKQHNSLKAAWEFYTRAPCHAPLYEIDDSIRDTSHSLSAAAKFSNKMPLVLIVDTGSGREDLLGIQQGKVHGLDFIVVDHHVFEEDVISPEVLVHINPFLVGEDGSRFSAGMLCTELARFINPDPALNILQIPAMAGLADRVDNPAALDGYLKHAATKGYDKDLLMDISVVLDFVSAKLRFMEAREYIEVLFGEPMEKQKALVSLLAPYIKNLDAKGLAIAKEAVEMKKVGNITVQYLDIEKNFPRFFYPKPGRCVSMIHDHAQEEKKGERLVTAGIMPDAMTLRATDESKFSVHEMIDYLNKKVPGAFVEGGGHKRAGSIKFIPSKQAKIIEAFNDFIKSIK
ncbi:MAG: hypothetical protein Q8Q31_00685 [Nanoarchaeota archaeon]|nr:hypothetical protein [Nanoarchaeota archaeon]